MEKSKESQKQLKKQEVPSQGTDNKQGSFKLECKTISKFWNAMEIG
jgi:hypothetical protein